MMRIIAQYNPPPRKRPTDWWRVADIVLHILALVITAFILSLFVGMAADHYHFPPRLRLLTQAASGFAAGYSNLFKRRLP